MMTGGGSRLQGVGPVPLVDVPAAYLERQGRLLSVIRIDLWKMGCREPS